MSSSPKTPQSFDRLDTTSRSSTSIGKNQSLKKPQGSKITKKNGLFALLATISVVTAVIGGINVYPIPEVSYENQEFDFFVYCSAYYQLKQTIKSSTIQQLKTYTPFGDNPQKWLTQYESELKRTYIVAAQDGNKLVLDSSEQSLRLRYCGFVREWNGDCENGGRFICSNPGPAFDVNENEQINVVWVNKIAPQVVVDNKQDTTNQRLKNVKVMSLNNCYNEVNETMPGELCSKFAKTKAWQNYTYYDPTNFATLPDDPITESIIKVPTNKYLFPLSPHVHGLEVRPTFDGNPLSWFDNNNSIGVGFFSAQQYYFQLFNSSIRSSLFKYLGVRSAPFKINVYPNVQSPGSLWYHDHTMGTTSFNVRMGLHSFYIIRNKTTQKALPANKYQKLVYMYQDMTIDNTYYNCEPQCINKTSEKCISCLNNPKLAKNILEPLQGNTTYRFRFLNGDFAKAYNDITFVSKPKCKNSTNDCLNTIVPFRVIGTDSHLRKKPTAFIKNISLASAERADILIQFTAKGIEKIQIQYGKAIILKTFTLVQKTSNGSILRDFQINVPQAKLANMAQSQIAVKRMRPLVYDNGSDFGINGHFRFHDGLSQNPQIGTVEDWYFINTIFFGHPIHVHLIQFQTIQYGSLRTFKHTINNRTQQCSYYILDFFRNVTDPKYDSNEQACNGWLSMRQPQFKNIFKSFKNQRTVNKNTKISGIDIMSTCNKNEDSCKKYLNDSDQCKLKPSDKNLRYKYVCNDTTDQNLQQYQKGWKQTVFVPKFTYVKIRILWASTDFNHSLIGKQQACKKGYFHIKQSVITEFPGYLYHCHILAHEDREMMRPIMMQPSHCKDVKPWSERYSQINAEVRNKTGVKKSQRYGDLRK